MAAGPADGLPCGSTTSTTVAEHFRVDLHRGRNTRSAAAAGSELRQEGDRVIMRGHLHLTDDEGACLRMSHWTVLFDLASPVPSSLDGSWVEIGVGTQSVSLHPYRT
ncbi:hypothetical protein [Streptomyces sp. NPDC060198]|uniref:hypothetical protein n=1 Tax=Streptomyces sp. NPDC060198 TaxID=3347070 RepID=UPI00365B9683